MRSAAILGFGWPFRLSLGGRGLILIRETIVDLFEDTVAVFFLGFQIARMIPLEMRLKLAANAPVGIAKMVVDDRIGCFQLDRAFKLFDGQIILAELVMRPAETVDDIAVGRP